jgi:hypothetical protein
MDCNWPLLLLLLLLLSNSESGALKWGPNPAESFIARRRRISGLDGNWQQPVAAGAVGIWLGVVATLGPRRRWVVVHKRVHVRASGQPASSATSRRRVSQRVVGQTQTGGRSLKVLARRLANKLAPDDYVNRLCEVFPFFQELYFVSDDVLPGRSAARAKCHRRRLEALVSVYSSRRR